MKALRLYADTIEPTNATVHRSHAASSHWKNPSVKIETLPQPEPTGKEILLEIGFCGVCGSDFHLTANSDSGTLYYPGLLELPVTIGHEFSGTVKAYGENVSAAEKKLFPLGTPVTAEEMLWCGRCGACRAGNVNHCENLEEIGFTVNGAHADFLKIDSKYCWSLQGLAEKFGVTKALQMGALVEPYAVSYRALFQAKGIGAWQPGASVLILGAGPIGLAAVDLARAAGASKIAVIEPIPARRELAKKIGAQEAWENFSENILLEKIAGFFGPSAVDCMLDAAGCTELVSSLAQKKLAVAGSLVLLARTNEFGRIDPEALITKNARILGSQGHSGESAFPRVIQMMEMEVIQPLRIVEKIITMPEALEHLRTQKKCAGKLLMQPKASS